MLLGPRQRGIPIQLAGYFYWNRSGFLELANFFYYHSGVKYIYCIKLLRRKEKEFSIWKSVAMGNNSLKTILPLHRLLLVCLNFSFFQYNRYSIWDYWPTRRNFRHTEDLGISFSTNFPLPFRQHHLDYHICVAGIFFFLSFTAKVVRWLSSYRKHKKKEPVTTCDISRKLILLESDKLCW